jgi:hypothetical protein
MMELRPLLRQYTVYPKFVDNPGIEHGELPAQQQAPLCSVDTQLYSSKRVAHPYPTLEFKHLATADG